MAEKMRALWKGDYRDRHDGEGNLVERVPSEFLAGIPARSLSEEDWDALDTEQRASVRASNLYDVRSDREMATPTSAPTSASASDEGKES